MAIYDDFLSRIANELKSTLGSVGNDFTEDALADAHEALRLIDNNLALYTKQLSNGQLSEADYSELIQDELNLVQMKKLEQVGLAKVKVDEVKRVLMQSVINVAKELI